MKDRKEPDAATSVNGEKIKITHLPCFCVGVVGGRIEYFEILGLWICCQTAFNKIEYWRQLTAEYLSTAAMNIVPSSPIEAPFPYTDNQAPCLS